MSPVEPGLQPGRNDPCPCGSGRKFKRCCKSVAASAADDGAADTTESGLRIARRCLDAGDLDGAERACDAIIAARPSAHLAHAARAQVLATRGIWAESEAGFRRAITGHDGVAKYHVGLATALLNLGRLDEALLAARQGAALDPSEVSACCVAALALERSHRSDEAITALRPALAHDPDHADANIILGRLEGRSGATAAARERLERIATRVPPPAQIDRAWHELGTVLDRAEAYEEAFEAFERAGHAQDRGPVAASIDRSAWHRAIEEARSAVGAGAHVAPDPGPRAPGTPPPTFLVGFPRSGTTLTEQVLAAHTSVVTTDEQPVVHRLRVALAARDSGTDLATCLAALDAEAVAALRATYASELAAVLPTPAAGRVIVDKLPLNLVHLPMIDALFPEARVIVALRDPRDVCLSCFMQHFRLNDAMINFLTLRRTVEFYTRVMGLWLEIRDRLRMRWIEVRYEDTIDDLEHQSRRILELLGLPWDPGVLDFHERARASYISTPSYEAVTEPVHRRRVGRWRNYQFAFEPVEGQLRRFVDAFGYG